MCLKFWVMILVESQLVTYSVYKVLDHLADFYHFSSDFFT